MSYRLENLFFGYTPTESAISPFKPTNRPLKTDCYNGTTYNRLTKLTALIGIFSTDYMYNCSYYYKNL